LGTITGIRVTDATNTLAHLMDEDFLTEAFFQLRKDAAAGIDQMTVVEYEVGLAGRIADLHRWLVAREYRAQPVRRVWIPKTDGGQRGLAILVLEAGQVVSSEEGVPQGPLLTNRMTEWVT
jgi:retron-type reverse transcriptase